MVATRIRRRHHPFRIEGKTLVNGSLHRLNCLDCLLRVPK